MPFQDYVTLTMLKNHIKETEKPVKLMERSMFSARYCFVEKMLSSGTIHEGMYHILQEWYDFLHQQHDIHADLIVYLRTTPEKAHERVKLRARNEESCVPIEYLQDLHRLHESWLIDGKFFRPAPVFCIDANLGLDQIIAEYQKSESQILRSGPSIYIENTNHGITVSPSKCSDRERMKFWSKSAASILFSLITIIQKEISYVFLVFSVMIKNLYEYHQKLNKNHLIYFFSQVRVNVLIFIQINLWESSFWGSLRDLHWFLSQHKIYCVHSFNFLKCFLSWKVFKSFSRGQWKVENFVLFLMLNLNQLSFLSKC